MIRLVPPRKRSLICVPGWIRGPVARWRNRREYWVADYMIKGSFAGFGGHEFGSFLIHEPDEEKARSIAISLVSTHSYACGDLELNLRRPRVLDILLGD